MKQQQTNTVMIALFLALSVMLVTGLVAVPMIEEADAKRCHTKDGTTICKVKIIKIK